MANEHIWPAAQSATNEAGLHRYVSFQAQTSSPALVVGTNTQVGVAYVTSAGNAFVFKNSAGTIVPLVNTYGGIAAPPGVTWPFAGTTAPTGFYMCTGGAFSRTTDAALYAVIGVLWGTGDGSTTFNVPDLQGFTVVGKSAGGIFATIASSTGGLTSTAASHAHALITREQGGDTSDYVVVSGSDLKNEGSDSYDATVATVNCSTEDTVISVNVVQPSRVMNYIIAR
jgi:microcystin-dependent protein